MSQGYTEEKWDRDRVAAAFAKLPSMDSGNENLLDPFWMGLNVIEAPYVAPTARAGNVRIMSMAIVNMAIVSEINAR